MENNPADALFVQDTVSSQQPSANNPADALFAVPQPQQEDQGWFMAGVDGLNRQFEKMAIGTMQLASYLVPNSQQFRDKLSQINQQGAGNGLIVGAEQADRSFQQHPVAYGAGAVLGLAGSAYAYGAPAAALGKTAIGSAAPRLLEKGAVYAAEHPALARTAVGAASGAGYGAVTPADSLGERATNTAIGAGMGAVASNIIPTLKAGKDLIIDSDNYASNFLSRIFNPKQAAVKDVAARASTQLTRDATNIDDSLQSFSVLDMQPTPAQAFGSPALQGVEDKAAKGVAGASKYGLFNESQLNQWRSKAASVIDSMADDEVKKTASELYPKLVGNSITDDSFSLLQQNPTIAKYLEKVNTPGSGVTLKNSAGEKINIFDLPNNDTGKLDYVKQLIDHDLKSVYKGNTKALDKNDIDTLMVAKNSILDTIDSQYGEIYTPARIASQKVNIQKEYNEILSKVPNIQGKKVSTEGGNSFNNIPAVNRALWGNDQKIAQFLDDVKTTGGDIETAKAVIDVANKISATNIDKILKANDSKFMEYLDAQGANANIAQRFFKTLGERGYQKAMLDITTSGSKWVPLIRQEIINQASEKDKQLGLFKLLYEASKPYIINKGASDIGTGVKSMIFPNNDSSNKFNPTNINPPIGAIGILG